MARYKETKERYQQMVNAITRNIEGVFMHGGKMAGAGEFGAGHYMADGGMMNNYEGLEIILPSNYEYKTLLTSNIESMIGKNYEDRGNKIFVRNKDIYGHGVTLSDLEELNNMIQNRFMEVEVELFAKGGHMAKGGELTYDDFIVGDFYFNSSEGGKFKFVGKDESGRLRFQDSKGIDRIFSPKRMSKYAKGGHMAKGGLTNIKGTTEPKAYPEAEPNTNVVV
jgi:hypothetical protein